jgi:hypothetical protein
MFRAVTIQGVGKTMGDLLYAIDEARGRVEAGNIKGRGSNEDGSFYFEVEEPTGLADAPPCEECGANIPNDIPSIDGSIVNRHHDSSCSLYDAEAP